MYDHTEFQGPILCGAAFASTSEIRPAVMLVFLIRTFQIKAQVMQVHPNRSEFHGAQNGSDHLKSDLLSPSLPRQGTTVKGWTCGRLTREASYGKRI